jgi:hypothetical protein
MAHGADSAGARPLVRGWLQLLWDWPWRVSDRRGWPELRLDWILYMFQAWLLVGWYLLWGLVLWRVPRAPASRLPVPESSLECIHIVRLGIPRALRRLLVVMMIVNLT